MNIDRKQIAPGVEMPVISIGTGGLERKEAKQIVMNWLELGGRGIDTALNYQNQEEIKTTIETFISTKKNMTRNDLFVTTKIPNCNTNNLGEQVEMDLHRLGMEYVDLVLIHSPKHGNCSAAWIQLEAFYASNQVRAIGVSNFQRNELEPILEIATVKPHVNQIHLNILQNNPDTIEFCKEHDIVIQSYSPLGRNGTSIPANPTIQTMATIKNVTTYQIAIKWILQHGWILTFQSTSKEHQAMDADVGFTLTPTDMKELDGLSDISSSSTSSSSSSSSSSSTIQMSSKKERVCNSGLWNCHRRGLTISATTATTSLFLLLLLFVIMKRRKRNNNRKQYRQHSSTDDDGVVVDMDDGFYNVDGSEGIGYEEEDGFAVTELL